MGLLDFLKSTEEKQPEINGNTIDEDIHNTAKDTLTEILDLMGFFNVVKILKYEENFVSLEIKGDDLGRIIGKDGNTLFALQLILRNMLSKKYKRSINIQVDANNYRERRTNVLKNMANEIADQVIQQQKDIALQPMNPWERRIIHMTLKDLPEVETRSEGRQKNRQVVVYPA